VQEARTHHAHLLHLELSDGATHFFFFHHRKREKDPLKNLLQYLWLATRALESLSQLVHYDVESESVRAQSYQCVPQRMALVLMYLLHHFALVRHMCALLHTLHLPYLLRACACANEAP
jgi:hypothetical protein